MPVKTEGSVHAADNVTQYRLMVSQRDKVFKILLKRRIYGIFTSHFTNEEHRPTLLYAY
jgi:hypothetical protein